jgi:hypothetical protein
MTRHWLSLLTVAAVCFVAAPAPNPVATSKVAPELPGEERPLDEGLPARAQVSAAAVGVAAAAASVHGSIPTRGQYAASAVGAAAAAALSDAYPLTDAELAELVRTDPVAALDACRKRVKDEVKGYRATLHKRERLNGTLHDPEVITVAVRAEPYAVLMKWVSGAREVKVGRLSLGKVEGVLYAGRETGGRMVTHRPSAALLPTTEVSPTGDQARASARYSIAEGSLFHAVERTYRAWTAAQRDGKLVWRYDGTKPIEQLGGRVCHVLTRISDPPVVDPFLMDEPPLDAKGREADASYTVTVMIDVQTWLQIGSEIRNKAGEPVGLYHFRDLVVNPTFPPDQFTREMLKR